MARPAFAKEAVRGAVASFMTFNDRVCFASVSSIAKRAGCCKSSAKTKLHQLEAAGIIEEDHDFRFADGSRPRTRCWRFCNGRSRGFCPLRTTYRRTNTTRTSYLRTNRSEGCSSSRTITRPRGRRRTLMEKYPEQIGNEGVVRRSGEVTPFNAGDAIAAVIDIFATQGIPLAPSVRARLGKGSKALIDSEFPPRVVVAACVVAIQTGWFGSVETIAQEMMVASVGGTKTRKDFQQALAETSRKIETSDSRVWQLMREDAARRAKGEMDEIQRGP